MSVQGPTGGSPVSPLSPSGGPNEAAKADAQNILNQANSITDQTFKIEEDGNGSEYASMPKSKLLDVAQATTSITNSLQSIYDRAKSLETNSTSGLTKEQQLNLAKSVGSAISGVEEMSKGIDTLTSPWYASPPPVLTAKQKSTANEQIASGLQGVTQCNSQFIQIARGVLNS